MLRNRQTKGFKDEMPSKNDILKNKVNNLSEDSTMFHANASSKKRVTDRKLHILAALLLITAFIVFPSCIRCMMFGAMIATSVMLLHKWLVEPGPPIPPFPVPELTSLPPPRVPLLRTETETPPGTWINKFDGEYVDQAFYEMDLESVYMELISTELILKTPKHPLRAKAIWNEEIPINPTFTMQVQYDISGSDVYLLPADLVPKHFWKKKYPICIRIPNSSDENAENGQNSTKLFLFARCDRDKEEWYRRLFAASSGQPLPTDIFNVLSYSSNAKTDKATQRDKLFIFLDFMARVIPEEIQKTWIDDPDRRVPRNNTMGQFSHTPVQCEPQLAWFNAIITRCLWDCLLERHWHDRIERKLQKRFDKIKLPYFMDHLVIAGMEPGREFPVIQRASAPSIDNRGLWVDLDIAYTGGFTLRIESNVNLLKMTRKFSDLSLASSGDDSSEEASGSEDEQDEQNLCTNNAHKRLRQRGRKVQRIFGIMEKFAQNKFVQKASRTKFFKKRIKCIWNAKLILIVQIRHISGCLAVNIPNPPTDRLWFGFRTNPCLTIKAVASVDENSSGFSKINHWIEKKLTSILKKFFVMPNMLQRPLKIMSDAPSPCPPFDECNNDPTT